MSASTAAFDRLTVGDVHHYGAHTFTAEEIKRFAGAYDPQAFHLDEAEAARSQFGKLAASGWHTTAVMMKLRVAYLAREAEKAAARGEPVLRFGPSPGFDNLKWIRPVHAGDTLTFTDEVTAKRKSQSRPGWGIVTMATKAVNQRGETAFSMTGHVFAATGEE